jgi:hypothetical protein
VRSIADSNIQQEAHAMLQQREPSYLHSTQLVVRRSKLGDKVVALLLLAVQRL